MKRRVVVLALAALAAFALPATALAGGGHGSHGKRLSGLDKWFLKELSGGNNFEIALNDLAQRKAVNQSVKDLGNHIAVDHAANEQRVEALAARYGVAIPGAPNATQTGVLELLNAIADPVAFETAWLKAQKAAHEDAALLLERFDARPAEVRLEDDEDDCARPGARHVESSVATRDVERLRDVAAAMRLRPEVENAHVR